MKTYLFIYEMSRKLSTDIYSPNGKLSFIIQHPETSIHYLSQLQNKFRPRKIDKILSILF